MNKQKGFLVLIAVSLVALIGTAIGCDMMAPTPIEPVAKPTVNSFAASQTSISQGQQTTLSWNVSGATAITIQPDIGTVGSSGSLMLSPNATTTYTLTASNQSGSSTGSVTVNVTPVVAGTPDLVITDIWLSGSQVYYKIKNQGNAVAPPSTSYFYINDLKKTTDWVDSLAPGEERTAYFSNLQWDFVGTVDPREATVFTYNVKACANADNAIAESNTANDCLIEAWGPQFTYDFLLNAHLAKWRSGAGELRWPMVPEDDNGAALRITYSPILVICPEYVSNGWIIGQFGEFYTDKESRAAMVRDIEVPILAEFTSKVGFPAGTASPDGVTVALGYYDAMGSIVFFPRMTVKADGMYHDYNVDLSSLVGKKTQFVLLVEANGSPEGDCVRWVEPKIIQKGESNP